MYGFTHTHLIMNGVKLNSVMLQPQVGLLYQSMMMINA